MTAESEEARRAAARWEGEGGQIAAPSPDAEDDLHLELKRYGIVPVETTVYEWGGHLYSNAEDAIAAAKRGRG